MNHPSHRSPRSAALLCGIIALLLLTSGMANAQPYNLTDPCSHYTIDYIGGWGEIQGTIPVDVELKHVPDVVAYPPINRHYDISSGTPSTQSGTFMGNLYYVGSIKVYGTVIPKDGQPHRVATGIPGVCVEVTITNDANGCPVISIVSVACCDSYTLSWDSYAVGSIVIERADHTTISRDLPPNSNPDIDNTTASYPDDINNPVIGIIVDGKHLGPGSTYRVMGETVGGGGHCVEYSVWTDPNTGCIKISVHNIPCPPHCPNYYISISANCEGSGYYPIYVDVSGHEHLGPGLNDHWTFTAVGSGSFPVPINVRKVDDVVVDGVNIPIDGLPHIINAPGSNGHYRLKVTATFDWETGCTTITIDCIYVIG